MPAIRNDIKTDLKLCRRSLADLCRETGIHYRRLAGAVMGYWYLRPEGEKQIRVALQSWKQPSVYN